MIPWFLSVGLEMETQSYLQHLKLISILWPKLVAKQHRCGSRSSWYIGHPMVSGMAAFRRIPKSVTRSQVEKSGRNSEKSWFFFGKTPSSHPFVRMFMDFPWNKPSIFLGKRWWLWRKKIFVPLRLAPWCFADGYDWVDHQIHHVFFEKKHMLKIFVVAWTLLMDLIKTYKTGKGSPG